MQPKILRPLRSNPGLPRFSLRPNDAPPSLAGALEGQRGRVLFAHVLRVELRVRVVRDAPWVKAKWRVRGERGSAKIAYTKLVHQIPSTKFCEGFWDFVAVSSPTGPPFHELSTNSLGFYECPAPSTMLVEQVFCKTLSVHPSVCLAPWDASRVAQGDGHRGGRNWET